MAIAADPRPATIGFLLVPGFAILSYSAAVEPLRAANVLSGRELYRWRHLSPDGATVLSSNGVGFSPDQEIGAEDSALDSVLICAGGTIAEVDDHKILAHLRRLERRGVTIGGISGGPFIMAKAGLLEGRRCTVHWEYAAAFEERFPNAILTRSIFEIDGNRITCAGAIAALDMMCALIARDHGAALGAAVSDWFLHTQIRSGMDPHRMDLRLRTGVSDERILKVLKSMEDNIESPVSREDLASVAGISLRQLERAFTAQLGHGLHDYYLGLRLARARQLLRESAMSVSMVAVVTGFTSSAHFSHAFRKHFGMSPRQAGDPRRFGG